MTMHISDELPRLLTGEAAREEVLAGAAHLRTCPDCHDELVSALVSHASLSSARRFAPDLVERGETEHEVQLPDLSAVFAQVRAEAASPVARVRGSRRGRHLAVAAAAVVLAGAAAVTAAALTSGSSAPEEHYVALVAYDVGTSRASAELSDAGSLTIDAAALPHVTGQRYEVWLTDAARTRMQPVGWVGSNGRATLSVPTDLMGTYSYIEVSRQKVSSSSYDYSGVSVLRGKYTA